MNHTGLKVEKLSYGYLPDKKVLKELTFSASGGELVSILGKNGVGKSTLFKCILGLVRDYEGNIYFTGADMRRMSAKELSKKVAYIPQSHNLSVNYSVLDMVLMGSANQISSIGSPGKRQESEAAAALEKVGLAGLSDRGFRQISGGERQLVLMARAIMQDAKVWILDEPLSNLDYGNQMRVLKALKGLASEGYLIIQSIHNPDQAYKYSDRVIAIKDGTVVKEGRPQEIMDDCLIRTLYGSDVEWRRQPLDIPLLL